MDNLLESISLILATLFILFLFFIVQGDPDIWDLAHTNVIQWLK